MCVPGELQYRRECVLNTVASVVQHFLQLYTSRNRQCKLGYDSSAACDSYQLGEMIKFLTSRGLLFLVNFAPASLDSIPDLAIMDIRHILNTLKQCPSYQIDRNHTNCGLRNRVTPIVDYLRTMLSSNVVAISHKGWQIQRSSESWIPKKDQREGKQPFRFTRSVSGDQRLMMDNVLWSSRLAKDLFTDGSWDWTPED